MNHNIVYLLDNPQLYGSEMHVLDIVTFMNSKYNIKVIVFQDGPLLKELRKNGIEYHVVKSGYYLGFKKMIHLIRMIADFNTDIIHAHQPKGLFIGSIISLLTKRPLISTIHSQPIDHAMIHKGIKRKIVFYFHKVIGLLSQSISVKNIFVSDFMLQKSYYPKKSILIYNWVKPNLLRSSERMTFRSTLKKKIKLLAIGSVTYSKGYDLLFDFVDKIIKNNIEISLDILGGIDHSFIDECKKIYSKEIFNFISFHEYSSDTEKYYTNADLFILFSRSETFGLVYAEAMSYGIPIIAGDLEVLNEIIPKINSLSFDNKKNILFLKKIVNDNDFRLKIYNANKTKVFNCFNYRESMDKLNDQYIKIIRRS
jgi:glycosyltransferase involved in cell wall biosynthesis